MLTNNSHRTKQADDAEKTISQEIFFKKKQTTPTLPQQTPAQGCPGWAYTTPPRRGQR